MAKVHAIRRQIRSVKNINQITKAMEMVAASKLRKAQEATYKSRQYAIAARELLRQLRHVTSSTAHPLFARREKADKRLLIIFTSDRGLAGAYNSNIFKALLPLLPAKLIVVGNKGAQFVSRLSDADTTLLGVYPAWSADMAGQELMPIVSTVVALYKTGEVDEVAVLFTDYVSSLRQVVTRRVVLPIDPPAAKAMVLDSEARTRRADKAQPTEDKKLFEPSPEAVLNYVVPRFVEVQIYQAYLEALASEHSMRMVAMKSASDNASDITADLTLLYNGARQAAITQELAEITAGADAIS